MTFNFKYQPFEHDITMIGEGGTGKTYLAEKLLINQALRNIPLAVWDPQDEFGTKHGKLDGVEIVRSVEEVPYGRSICKPESKSPELFDKWCAKINSWTNIVCIVDEAHFFVGKFKIKSQNFREIILGGRPRGITYVAIGRRPADIHNSILSDAEHIFCFYMDLPTDVAYMAKWIGPQVWKFQPQENRPTTLPESIRNAPMLPPHWFLHKDKLGNFDIAKF